MATRELDELARSLRKHLKSPNGKSVVVPIKFLERALKLVEKIIDDQDGAEKEQLSKEVELMEINASRIYPVMGISTMGKTYEKKIKKKVSS